MKALLDSELFGEFVYGLVLLAFTSVLVGLVLLVASDPLWLCPIALVVAFGLFFHGISKSDNDV